MVIEYGGWLNVVQDYLVRRSKSVERMYSVITNTVMTILGASMRLQTCSTRLLLRRLEGK